MILRDIRGRSFDFAEPPRRVVSLVPSLTETLFDIGAENAVAGVTDFCIFPRDLDRPRVGGTKNPSIDAIRALGPDLVYMNLEENLERHARMIEEIAPVFVTEPKSVDDVSALIARLGSIHRRDVATWIEELRRARIEIGTFTFACPIWKKPWMWCGGDTYVSHLIEETGGTNLLRNFRRYPSVPLDEVLAMNPDAVFLPDEPYAFTVEDAAAIGPRALGPFPGHLLTWHGTRTILGLRFLVTELRDRGLPFMRKQHTV